MDKGSIIRTVILVVTLLNQILVPIGISPLPFDDAELETIVSSIITAVVALWTWWKNNYISKKGLKQKEVLKQHGLTNAK